MKEMASRIRKVEELIGLMQKNLECSICLDLLNNPVSTKCDHQFCRFCITEFLHKKSSVPCPLCKKAVTKRSLSERPKLGDIVNGIRRLMTAFHTDQGSSANASKGSQSGLPSSTSLALQPRSTGCFKRSLEPANSSITQNEKSPMNLRQSKRRKTEVTHVFIDDLTEPSEAADLVQTHVNVSGGFPASRVRSKNSTRKGKSPSRRGKQSNTGQVPELPDPVGPDDDDDDDGESVCQVELVRFLEDASCGAYSTSPKAKTQSLEDEEHLEFEPDGGSVYRGSSEEKEEKVHNVEGEDDEINECESNCEELSTDGCITDGSKGEDERCDVGQVDEDVTREERSVSGTSMPVRDCDLKTGRGEQKHTYSSENKNLNGGHSDDPSDLADSLDYGFMEEKFGIRSQTGTGGSSQQQKIPEPSSLPALGRNVAGKFGALSGDSQASSPLLDKSKSCRTYAARNKNKKVSNWIYNLPTNVGNPPANSGCTTEPSGPSSVFSYKSHLAEEGKAESEKTTKRPHLARRIFKSRQFVVAKRSTPPREETTDLSAEDDPYEFKPSQRTPKRGKNQKGRKSGKRGSRGRLKSTARERKAPLHVVEAEKTNNTCVTMNEQSEAHQVVLETQPFEVDVSLDENVLNGEEESDSIRFCQQRSEKVSPKPAGRAVSDEASAVSDSDSSMIPPSVFVPSHRRVLRSAKRQHPVTPISGSCINGKKTGKQRKNRKQEAEAKEQVDQRDMDKLISKITQAESFELMFSSQDIHKQMMTDNCKQSQMSTKDKTAQDCKVSLEDGITASEGGLSGSQHLIQETIETNAQSKPTKGQGDPKAKIPSVSPRKVISYELPSIPSLQSASSNKTVANILPSADVIAPTLSKIGKLLKSIQVKRKTPCTAPSPVLVSKSLTVSDSGGETSEDNSASVIPPTGQADHLANASAPPKETSPSSQNCDVSHCSGSYPKAADNEDKSVPSTYLVQKPINLQDVEDVGSNPLDAAESSAVSPGLLLCTEDSDSSSTEDLDIHPTSEEYAVPEQGDVHMMSTKTVAETVTQKINAVAEGNVDEDVSTVVQGMSHLSPHSATDLSAWTEENPVEGQPDIPLSGKVTDPSRKADSLSSSSENFVPESLAVLDSDPAQGCCTDTHEESAPLAVADSVDISATGDKLNTKDDDHLMQAGNVVGGEHSPNGGLSSHVEQGRKRTEMEEERNENKVMAEVRKIPTGSTELQLDEQVTNISQEFKSPEEMLSQENVVVPDRDTCLVPESCGEILQKSNEFESLTVVPPSIMKVGLDRESNLIPASAEKESAGTLIDVQSSTDHWDSDKKSLRGTQDQKSSPVADNSSSFVSVTPGASVEVVQPIRASFTAGRDATSGTSTDGTASPKSAEFPVALPHSDDGPLCSMRTRSFRRRRSPRVSYENLPVSSLSLNTNALQECSNDKPDLVNSKSKSKNSEELVDGMVKENDTGCDQNKVGHGDTLKGLPKKFADGNSDIVGQQATKSRSLEDGLNDSVVEACTEETLPPSMDMGDVTRVEVNSPSLTETQFVGATAQESASVIPSSMEDSVSSAQISSMKPSRKRTLRSAKQDSDAELKQDEPVIRRVKRTRSQRSLMHGSGSLQSPSSTSQSILTEPKTQGKCKGQSSIVQNKGTLPSPSQACQVKLREQSPESGTRPAKASGTQHSDSVALINNLVKSQVLKAKMSKGNFGSPSAQEKNNSILGASCQNTSAVSKCLEEVTEMTPAMVSDLEEDPEENDKGKKDVVAILKSSAVQEDCDRKWPEKNESLPCGSVKVGKERKHLGSEGQGATGKCENPKKKQQEGDMDAGHICQEEPCLPDMSGSVEIVHRPPVEEVSEKSEKVRKRRCRRGRTKKPVIVETDSDSDSPFELTDVAEIENQEVLTEQDIAKDSSLKSSQLLQVCLDGEQSKGNGGSKSKRKDIAKNKPIRPVISDDSDDDDRDEHDSGIMKLGDTEEEECSQDNRSVNLTSSSALSSQSELLCTQQRSKLEQDVERMKQEIEALEAQLAARDSILLESTVREPNVTLDTSHLESTLRVPSAVEMETSDAYVTVREPGDVEVAGNDADVTLGEPDKVEMERNDADVTLGEPDKVEMESNFADVTVREPDVQKETSDVNSSMTEPNHPDTRHERGIHAAKRQPESMQTDVRSSPEEEKSSPTGEEDITNEIPPTDASKGDNQCLSPSQESEDLFLSPRSPSPPPSLPDANIKPSAVSQVVSKLKEIFKTVSPSRRGNSPNKYRSLSPDSAESTPPCSPRSLAALKSISKHTTSDTSLVSPAGTRVKAGLPKPFQSPAFAGVPEGKGSLLRTRQRSDVMSPLGRTTPSGSERPASRRLCFVTTGLHLSQAQKTQKLAQMFRIKIQPKFSPAATHVIVNTVSEDSLVCERTFKYFQAIAHHCWLVSYQWVEDCITANDILPETGYEIQGDTVSGPKHRGPRRSRLYNNPVFADFEFFCHGDSPNLPPGEFQNLLTVSGGTVVTSPDALGVDPDKTQLVLDLNDDQQPNSIRLFNRLYRKYGVVTVSREWVFDTITQYKVQPLPSYVLTAIPNMELPFV